MSAPGRRGALRERPAPVAYDTERRFMARARARRWRRVLRTVLLVALVGLVGAAAWGALLSPAVAVREVRIEGAPAKVRPLARSAAATQLGQPFLRVDTEAVRRELAAVPAVARVDVSRRWPHALVVTVIPRTPAAAARTASGYRLLDAGGMAYDLVEEVPEGVPVVTVDPDRSDPRTIEAVVAVAGALPPGLRESVRSIRADSPDAVVLRLDTGAFVQWGSAARSARKAEVLEALLRVPGRARNYDVSAPDVATIR